MYRVKHEKPFEYGYNTITREGEQKNDTMMDFGILLIKAGESYECHQEKERAFLLMGGKVTFQYNTHEKPAERQSLFEENPAVLHVPQSLPVNIMAVTEAEIAIIRTHNARMFEPKLYEKPDTRDEHRGAGTMGETSTRIVRTTFDDTNAPHANLVVGEVIDFPGKWSSYPPHHHPQPEIYHYRFFPEQGFGHATVGEDVLKVKHGDTVKIINDLSHPQVAAPGYAMYYIWVIRHLDGNRYGAQSGTPIFEPEHLWVAKEDAIIWPEKAE